MQKEGAGFAGFSTYLDMSPSDPDMAAIPDPNSFIQLPWQMDVGWLAADLWMNGKPVDASPRVMLRNQINKLAKKNMYLKSGVECEYFLVLLLVTRLLTQMISQTNHAMINLL